LAQTAVWHHEMVVRKRERKLIFQVVLVFREGIDLPSHPSGLLAYRQVVVLHAIPYSQNIRTRLPTGDYASTIARPSACLPLHSLPYSASRRTAKPEGETMDWKRRGARPARNVR